MDNKSTGGKKKKKLKTGYVLATIIIVMVLILIIKLMLPSNVSKYGDRLDGIKDISFNREDKNKIVDKIKENDKVTEAKIDVEGKIINIIFNVKTDASEDDAKKIANDSLSVISSDVKNFYDIEYMVTRKGEVGKKEKIKKDDGNEEEVTVTTFPIMGYKKYKSNSIVWTNHRE